MSALLTLAAGVLGYWIGRADGAFEEKRRITKLLASMSREASR